ncbi:MAG: DUF975 family protein [Miniphocaeibacter sp.]|uniref:DUF975 family protein n=1 Tax=Miniphocaeibacter sp. TaxID=3100973 RepID=UPI00180A742C|nr:DUF975 family protein [Gallicola sp.]
MNWNRKELKLRAKKTIKRNYIQYIIVCLVIAIVAGGYTTSHLNTDLLRDSDKIKPPAVVDSVVKILDGFGITNLYSEQEEVINRVEDKFNLRNATEGFFATIINNSGASRSFVIGLLNTINQLIFNNRFLQSTIMIISTILIICFWLFIQNILIVGQSRFFIENKSYSNTKIDRILFIYRIGRIRHTAYIMFCKYIFNFLWFFTIIGGFIKYYDYKMIPFIVAENPEISRKDAWKLSHEMMLGNKWKAFKLDLSFLIWHILSLLTFGIIRYLYLNPLIGASYSELYFVLREEAIKNKLPLSVYFNDKYLTNPIDKTAEVYPVELYTIPEKHKKDWLQLDYDRKYSLTSYILIFFSIAFVGWIWEIVLHLLKQGVFVNRGTMLGPWLPIYGTGTLLMLILLKPFVEKPLVLFPSAMVICGVLEYFTSWALEKLFNTTWWNYKNVFFNINGRVCFEGLLFFAIGGFLIIYFIAPLIDEFLQYIPIKIKRITCLILILLFTLDLSQSVTNPNTGKGISRTISYNQLYENKESLSLNEN